MTLDATPGCSHLASHVQSGKDAKKEFANGLAKARRRAQKVDDSQSRALRYHCVQCTEAGGVKQMEIHHAKTQHAFSFSSESSAVYCALCRDMTYDKMAKRPNLAASSSSSDTPKKRKTSEANGDDSYITANSSQRPCGREGARGLFNLGHTCYMNAVIQTMVHNSLLSSFFLGKGHPIHTCSKNEDDEEDVPCVACGFTEIFSESRVAENTQPMAALSLLKASWLAIPEMQGERQQDSHEWYLQIIDKLHECEKPAYDSKGVCRCFIHKAFYGRTSQEIACNKCGFVSRTQEQMLYLALNFQKQLAATTSTNTSSNKKKSEPTASTSSSTSDPAPAPPPIPTMAACLEDLTTLENLSDDTYSCRGCDKKGQMTKTVRIRKLPAILCMQVNRFQNEIRGGNVVQKKIKGRVQYPLEIDMKPYTTRGGGRRGKGKGNGKNAKEEGSRKGEVEGGGGGGDDSGFLYELESVIVHEGKAIEQGHYFAFCRAAPPAENKSPSTETGRREWYMFNDAKVTVAAENLVLEQEAYLLFYSLKRICGAGGEKR
ncbi:hypothetical protein GJ744_007135 [Endocarpon pusillum]|uniref:USP domain-containing protein n=1 Tax=Endocarpon pusillum TaxID=364733 RepID=A0A8H7AMY7_9EURO|nr:hypothetical protein GJ744_007135 [Endocarpon pusillum]